MKITDVKVSVGGQGKNYVIFKRVTDQWIHGLGYAALNNRETLPAAYWQDDLMPNLIGRDPRSSGYNPGSYPVVRVEGGTLWNY